MIVVQSAPILNKAFGRLTHYKRIFNLSFHIGYKKITNANRIARSHRNTALLIEDLENPTCEAFITKFNIFRMAQPIICRK